METPAPRFSVSRWFDQLRLSWCRWFWEGSERGLKGLGLTGLRLLFLSVRGLFVNRSLVRASALAYLTGLAIIPLLALLFAILKSLGIQRLLATHLLDHLAPGSKDFALQILHYIENTQVASLGVFGIVALFADLIILMNNVERAFNDTWGVGRTRPWRRKLSDYLSIFLILPLLMAVAITIATSLVSHPQIHSLLAGVLPKALLATTSGLVSLGLFWLAFTFIYLVMPNTRVHFLSAALGGLVGAALWQAAQLLLAWFHAQASYYNAIYGVVYHLLFFTLWMYWSWLIVLFGNEVARAHQHRERLSPQDGAFSPAPPPVDEYLGLAGLVAIAARFLRREPPLNLEELTRTLGNGDYLATQVVATLKKLNLVLEVTTGQADGLPAYVPALPPEQITVGGVLHLLRQVRREAVSLTLAREPGLTHLLRSLASGPATTPWDNLTVQELVTQAAADPPTLPEPA